MYTELLSKMTIEEKAQMVTGYRLGTKMFPEYGITDTIEVSDGPAGIRTINRAAPKVKGGNVQIPCPASLAATWDRKVAQRAANVLALNCLYVGVSMLLAPGVNIVRSPLNGRNFEYFSEDPYLAGEFGAAYVNGLQEYGVGTSVKHFAANQQENHRKVVNAEIAERALREIYLYVFEIIVKKSKPTSIMNAYNKVNGHYCSENKKLQKDILRGEWGFEGAVISDWGAVHDTGKSLRAGCDLIMPGRQETIVEEVKKAYQRIALSFHSADNDL